MTWPRRRWSDHPHWCRPRGGQPVEVAADPAGQPLALVFKTVADPYVGKISLFKVLSGTVRPDAALFNPRSRSEERLHALFTFRGKEQLPETEVPAGDIGAVAKLAATNTGDTLTPRNQPVTLVRPALPGSGAPAPADGDGYVDGSTSWLADTAPPCTFDCHPAKKQS